MAGEPSFLGTGWDFPPTFHRELGGVAMVAGEADVQSSLEILLSTRVGERVMQPRYGCNLDRLVFDPVDTGLHAYVKDLIRTAILYFEPRVVLDSVTLQPNPAEGRLDIAVACTVAATNTRANFVYPFYRREGTEVRS
jgi:phage baseplate assembly protein W